MSCALTAVDAVFAIASVQATPSVEVSIRYPVIGAPPFADGAIHVSAIVPSPATALDQVGADADPYGVAIATFDGVALAPATVNARTRNRYSDPFVRPETTALVPGFPVLATTVEYVVPPFALRSITYPVIGAPPVVNGAVHDRTTAASSATAVNEVGASATASGRATTVDDAIPTPIAFIAETRKSTGTPFVRPVTVVVNVVTVATSDHAPPPTDFSTR